MKTLVVAARARHIWDMEWRDQGILLGLWPMDEATARIEVFTALHGRAAGAVRGGASRKMAPILQPAAQLDVTWRARLEDQLGRYTVELMQARAATIMQDRLALLGLGAVCALCRFALPDRMAYPRLYAETVTLLDRLGQSGWLRAYVAWELILLEETGFGLDLQQCAVTGAQDGLAYVSPRSGRAVTTQGAGDYAARLLPLPPAMLSDSAMTQSEAVQALNLSGHFLQNWLAASVERALPEARARLIAALSRA